MLESDFSLSLFQNQRTCIRVRVKDEHIGKGISYQ